MILDWKKIWLAFDNMHDMASRKEGGVTIEWARQKKMIAICVERNLTPAASDSAAPSNPQESGDNTPSA